MDIQNNDKEVSIAKLQKTLTELDADIKKLEAQNNLYTVSNDDDGNMDTIKLSSSTQEAADVKSADTESLIGMLKALFDDIKQSLVQTMSSAAEKTTQEYSLDSASGNIIDGVDVNISGENVTSETIEKIKDLYKSFNKDNCESIDVKVDSEGRIVSEVIILKSENSKTRRETENTYEKDGSITSNTVSYDITSGKGVLQYKKFETISANHLVSHAYTSHFDANGNFSHNSETQTVWDRNGNIVTFQEFLTRPDDTLISATYIKNGVRVSANYSENSGVREDTSGKNFDISKLPEGANVNIDGDNQTFNVTDANGNDITNALYPAGEPVGGLMPATQPITPGNGVSIPVNGVLKLTKEQVQAMSNKEVNEQRNATANELINQRQIYSEAMNSPEVQQAKENVTNTQNAYKNSLSQLSKSTTLGKKVKTQLNTLQKSKAKIEKQVAKAEEKLEAAKEKANAAAQAVQEREAAKNEAQTRADAAAAAVESANEKVSTAKQELSSAKIKVTAAKANVKLANGRLSKAKAMPKTVKTKDANGKTKVVPNEARAQAIAEAKQDVAEAKAELAEAKAAKKEAQANLKAAQAEQKAAKAEKKAANKALKSANKAYDKALKNSTKAEKAVVNAQKSVDKANANLAKTEASITTVLQQIVSNDAKNAQLAQEVLDNQKAAQDAKTNYEATKESAANAAGVASSNIAILSENLILLNANSKSSRVEPKKTETTADQTAYDGSIRTFKEVNQFVSEIGTASSVEPDSAQSDAATDSSSQKSNEPLDELLKKEQN